MQQAADTYTQDWVDGVVNVDPNKLEWQLLSTNNLPKESKEYAVSTFDDTVFLATFDVDKGDFDSYYPIMHWAEIS